MKDEDDGATASSPFLPVFTPRSEILNEDGRRARHFELARVEAESKLARSLARSLLSFSSRTTVHVVSFPSRYRSTSRSLSFGGRIARASRGAMKSAHYRALSRKAANEKRCWRTRAKAFLDGSPTSYGAGRVTGLDKHDPLTSVTSSFAHEPRARENRAGRRLTSPREMRRYNS